MRMIQHIIDLSKKELSQEGYKKLISLVRHFINKYNWPKQILDETDNQNYDWHLEEIILFTHQFIAFLFEKNKLKNIDKIPEEYIEYYFHQVIVTYVSSKIQQFQKRTGISYETVKRIVKEILTQSCISTELKEKMYWAEEEKYNNEILPDSEIESQVSFLPKIPIHSDTKHFKPLVINAVSDIFSLTETSIEENLLIKMTYSLLDQSSFLEIDTEDDEQEDFDDEMINSRIKQIIQKMDSEDIPLLLDYFFREKSFSLSELAEKNNIPKSTVHYKMNKFKELLQEILVPNNEDEGKYFLKKLHKKLDEIE